MTAALLAEDVSVRLGDRRVLDHVTLRVDEGEWVALVGRNGAGKSTLVDVLLGLRRPDGGVVRVAGAPPPSRSVGFVPQDTGASLLPWLDVADNVALPLRLAHATAAERARGLDAAWSQVPLAARIARDARTSVLSGGERQLVALLRALATRPSILVADEPFAALDRDARGEAHAALRALRDAGVVRTALIVTHDAADVAALADRVHVVGAGVAAAAERVA